MNIRAYAALSADAPLAPFKVHRRNPEPHDVQIEILYCGICHSDLHVVRNEWNHTVYPVVPGHEIVGCVTAIGPEVKAFKMGDIVAVGCMVDSCHTCSSCKEGLEQYCDEGMTQTYNGPDVISGGQTFGGYSTQIVVNEKFVLRVPAKFKKEDLPGVAPLVCAGITTYSALCSAQVKKNRVVGIVGLGGLGHMAVKLARAMGAHVVVFTTSENKVKDAIALGAQEVVLSTKKDQMMKQQNRFDFIMDTVASSHNLDDYLALLKRDGSLCLIGVPKEPHPAPSVAHLIFKRKKLTGSLIGGIKETQEMLNFCAEHGITADIEMIPMQKINEAYERMLKNDVKYRFVIDLASLKQ